MTMDSNSDTNRQRQRTNATHRLPYNEFTEICTGDMPDVDRGHYEDRNKSIRDRRVDDTRFFAAEAPTKASTCSTTNGRMGLMIDEIRYTMELEGGDKATDIKEDKGGLTKFGISQVYHPDVDVANLTETQAVSIYIEDYWNPMWCSHLSSKRVRWKVFDTAVMFGVKRATLMLQDIADVDADGKMGPRTLDKLNAMPEDTLLAQIAFAQIRRRATAVIQDSSQIKFFMGWLNRAQDLGYKVENG